MDDDGQLPIGKVEQLTETRNPMAWLELVKADEGVKLRIELLDKAGEIVNLKARIEELEDLLKECVPYVDLLPDHRAEVDLCDRIKEALRS